MKSIFFVLSCFFISTSFAKPAEAPAKGIRTVEGEYLWNLRIPIGAGKPVPAARKAAKAKCQEMGYRHQFGIVHAGGRLRETFCTNDESIGHDVGGAIIVQERRFRSDNVVRGFSQRTLRHAAKTTFRGFRTTKAESAEKTTGAPTKLNRGQQ
jgi:hypothetical protein